MAEQFEVSDHQAKQFSETIWGNDSSAAAHMLDDIGSCGWQSLIEKTNQVRPGMKEPLQLRSHTELLDGEEEGKTDEKITVYNQRFKAGPSNIATVTDASCKDK